MSIVAYIGRPGSGKSYGVVENVILPALRKSRTVVTNIPLHQDALQAAFDAYRLLPFTAEDYAKPEFWLTLPAGAVVVLDEVWRAFPAGLTQDKIPPERREFLAEHRHQVGEDGFSTEVVLVTQDLKQIAASIRSLIDKLYVAEKLDAVGATHRYRVDIYQGSEAKEAKFIRSVQGRYRPEVYRFYQSHTKAQNAAVAGIEERPDQRATIWGNKLLIIAIPLCWIGLLWAGFQLWHTVNGGIAPEGAVVTTPEPVPPAPPAPRVIDRPPPVTLSAPAPPPEPQESKRWRVVGSHSDGRRTVIHLRSVTGERRRVAATRCQHDGLEWACDLGTERITPWSGRVTLAAIGRAPQLLADQVADTARTPRPRPTADTGPLGREGRSGEPGR